MYIFFIFLNLKIHFGRRKKEKILTTDGTCQSQK